MAQRIALHHHTRYEYDRGATLTPHLIRLRPAPHCRTPIRSYSLKVAPVKHFVNWQQDPFGNFVARYVFPDPTRELSIDVDLVVDLVRINPFDFFVEGSGETWPFVYEPSLARDLAPYLEVCESGPLLSKWVGAVDRSPRNTVDFLVELNQRLSREIKYMIRLDPGIQTCETTLEKALGSCRDSAWLLAQILRQLGLASRFASGYLVQLKPDEKSLDGPSGAEQDFTDLHAWTEVFLPGAGWIGLDPTSGLFAGEGHIPLSCTPDPASAAPVTGATSPCEVVFTFSNSVTRIHEDPRVTKPYTDDEWERIEATAAKVESALRERDVRLTMGGEPTFVSIDDMDGAQWNTAALGADKRRLAGVLLRRLRDRFAPCGLLHFGQGKWYPGEELPRWAAGCWWRRDGLPVWKEKSLIAQEERPAGSGVREAETFLKALAPRLGLSPEFATPGFEDELYYQWKEQTLPINADPLKPDSKDPLERKRLARLMKAGLDGATGYALPLRHDSAGWKSDKWEFRRGRMVLIPGDSPMGYRLPLDSLVSAPRERARFDAEPCPFEPRPQLRDPSSAAASARAGKIQEPAPEASEKKPDPAELARTALCVEPREGHLYVFLPPIHFIEHFLGLIAAIEQTAAALKIPVFIEGYTPPHDSRMNSFRLTPDPGVIEANMQPAMAWDELKQIQFTLFEEARLTRLGTEKFMLDGRHSGTGGGNHITLGGPTPADSPFIRRPDLLRSLLGFWQSHPSLSYLFSGQFIGPTSQAPRIDEPRDESLYELEIAFERLPRGSDPPPWLIDRVLRNHLVDITGNTHRTEFSIDKLYSPDGYQGRLGLVEIRCFEMPPHARMSLAQMLLVRAMIAKFWSEPYRPRRLPRWGTELHDRFMLPHHVRKDFSDALAHLRDGGFDLDPAWFDAFHEFRFPKYGDLQLGDLNMELRAALEPWDVLGEEMHLGTTARLVDSSVERLQVKVSGMVDARHIVACNGRRVPLRSTGRRGEFVAGVRFQAWSPPYSRHPTISVQSPLVFDMIDEWAGRSIGGCTYHVMHPSGRNYERFPVNDFEAESRRIARFETGGYTPGRIAVPQEEPTGDFPWTLDLRRPADA